MRLLLQRVSRASVRVEGQSVAETGAGLLVLAGFGTMDRADLAASPAWAKMIDKTFNLRIFPDPTDKLNLSLNDILGDLMLVSQFTLYADCRKGRRPSFSGACPPDTAQALYGRLESEMRDRCPGRFGSGVFGAEMELDFVNHGPVTILLDSEQL